VADHLTEEEQVEALKRWWKENWLSIVLPCVVALVGWMGWSSWEDHKLGRAQAASDQFEALSKAAEVQPGAAMSAEQKVIVSGLAEALVSDFNGSLYADMGNLMLAKLHVEDKQLDVAASRLQEVVTGGANASIVQLASARLARVLAAKGDVDQALALVAQSNSETYTALFAEIRGDIYHSQGKMGQAHTAYVEALSSLPPSEFGRTSLIQLKRDAVAQSAPVAETEPTEAAAEGDA